MTLGIDIGVIKMILTHAAAVHGLEIRVEGVDLARVALKRLGLIGKGIERDRRPTTAELSRLFRCFDENARLTMPMTRIVQFAIATAMRLDEICRADWSDLDIDRRMLLIRDRKDPRNKAGNDQRIPLFAATGFDAWAIVMAQAKLLGKAKGPIFPYNSKSVGTAFRRAFADADVKDLHFHDLRHEGTSRLFEVGLSIEQVALLKGSPASRKTTSGSSICPTTSARPCLLLPRLTTTRMFTGSSWSACTPGCGIKRSRRSGCLMSTWKSA